MNPADTIPPHDLQNLVCDILSMTSLEYVAITTKLVPAATALRCLALKEFDMAGDWDESLFQDVPNHTEHEKPKLNTLCTRYHDVSLQILQTVLNLSGLTRLAVVQRYSNTPGGMFLLLAESCPLLQEVSIGIDGRADKVQCLLRNWRSSRFHISKFLPLSTHMKTKKKNVGGLDGRIIVMRLYCWSSFEKPPNTAEAEKLLRDQCGSKRDFEVHWMCNWADLTPFCELVDNE
ncbi:hypothetical protein DL96DRAFT_1681898 [Flagelloscypha sp. PMI_526]|nr:hypothetical protein DL96DRAFT_1681898 [Flagelloscypha sp. PMI_526]